MKTLRVGLFTYGMARDLTGIGRYTMELSYALKRLGAPMELMLLSPYPDSPLPWYQDFPVYPVPSLRRLPDVVVRGTQVLAAAAKKLQLDVLHDPCGIAPFLSRREQYGRVVTVHDAIPVTHPEFQPFLTKLVFRTLVPSARWTADAVITVSEHARRDIATHLGIQENLLHVIPLGTRLPPLDQLRLWRSRVEATLQAHQITPPYFLYVGAGAPRKNIPGILTAFEAFKKRRPDVNLVMVGPPPREPLRTPPGVKHLGYASQDVLDVLYVGASALVFPSFYEGFGIPVLEAMARGTPVITSNVSSLPEVVGNAGLLVDPYQNHEIEAAMAKVLNPQVAAELSFNGRIRARQFGWEEAARKTFHIYQRVAGKTREPIVV